MTSWGHEQPGSQQALHANGQLKSNMASPRLCPPAEVSMMSGSSALGKTKGSAGGSAEESGRARTWWSEWWTCVTHRCAWRGVQCRLGGRGVLVEERGEWSSL